MHFWTIWILIGKEGKVSDDRADVAGADEDGGGGIKGYGLEVQSLMVK